MATVAQEQAARFAAEKAAKEKADEELGFLGRMKKKFSTAKPGTDTKAAEAAPAPKKAASSTMDTLTTPGSRQKQLDDAEKKAMGYAKGGKIDGCAQRGKTKGRMR